MSIMSLVTLETDRCKFSNEAIGTSGRYDLSPLFVVFAIVGVANNNNNR
jgi:hypothetical protein